MKNIGVRIKLIILTLPLIACIIVLVIFAATQIRNTSEEVSEVYYSTLYKTSELLINADRDLYQADVDVVEILLARQYIPDDQFESMVADYEENVQQVYDRIHEADSIAKNEPSLYNDVLAGTSDSFSTLMQRTEKELDVWKGMIDLKNGGGEEFEAANEQFQKVRDPLGELGDVVEQWAGEEHKKLEAENTRTIVISAVVFAAISVALLILAIYIMSLITKPLAEATEKINQLADGDLRAEFDESRVGNDEVGTIYKSAAKLADKLSSIISQTKQMSGNLKVSGSDLADSSGQASAASGQVSEAVNEVSKGAVSQAESVQTAAADTDGIGRDIETITDNVGQLDSYAQEMKLSCDRTMEAMDQLIAQSKEVTDSVHEIDKTIQSTNESARGISKFSEAIMDIASQTNLLSLNASIEAARAGEAGKGFAVVADEIRQLADQSRKSADEIKAIVETLLVDAEASVDVMRRLNENFEQQGQMLDSTQQEVAGMATNVRNVSDSAVQISDRVQTLNTAKANLVEIIQDLSAISEENAASTEETNASMQELNATFSVINDSATQLQLLANDLESTISYFKN
ncbi:MAG: methyl-accepting chemotaxis protein [Lachnospiraceae bacterium]|nr:methyl-accepting chemotaxis protein [Lachnospiraceae bacterium]